MLRTQMVDAYAAKDPTFAATYFEEDAYLEIEGVGPVKGLKALNEYYAWQFKGDGTRWDFVCVSCLSPAHIIFPTAT